MNEGKAWKLLAKLRQKRIRELCADMEVMEGALHEVLHLVRNFRRAGRTKGLLDAVWYRLSDRALLERADLVESLEQMRRGEGREIDPAEFGTAARRRAPGPCPPSRPT